MNHASRGFSILVGIVGVFPLVCDAASTSPPSPPPTNSALVAGSTGSGAPIEAQVLAFAGVNRVASHIVDKICSTEGIADISTIIIYDAAGFAQLQSFEAFVANIKLVTAAYKTAIPDLAWLGVRLRQLADARRANDLRAVDHGLMPSTLADHLDAKRRAFVYTVGGDPFSDLVSLASAIAVSSNVETPNSVAIPDSSMALALTQLLTHEGACNNHKAGFRVIYPPLFGTGSSSDFVAADLDASVQLLQDVRQAAHEAVINEISKHPKGSEENGLLSKTIADIDGAYNNFLNSLLQTNSGTGMFGSAAVIQGYRLANILKDPSTRIVLASVVGAGGTEHDHKTFWTSLGSGDKLTYSGGLTVNVAMWSSTDGKVQLSQIMQYKSAFVDADGAVDQFDPKAGDTVKRVVRVATPPSQ
jgi:hypothetical protein